MESIAYHHGPGRCPSREFGPLAAVHAADAFDGMDAPEGPRNLDRDYLAALNLGHRLPAWEEACRRIEREGEGNE